MTISFVLAMSKNRAIGTAGHLPWHTPADLNRFKSLTKGHPIIMGSKTFESLPGGKALPRRTNIVLTRDPNKNYEGAHTFTDIGKAIRFAATQPGGQEVMVIGGGQIFAEILPLAHRIYLTIIDAEIHDADTFFPELDTTRWQVTENGHFGKDDQNEFGGTFYTYDRTNNYPIVEPDNGRNQEYKDQLQGILESGICPFCPAGETHKEQEILHTSKSWFLKENAHPLANTLYHFLITPIRHIQSVDEVTSEEWEDFKAIRTWLKGRREYATANDQPCRWRDFLT